MTEPQDERRDEREPSPDEQLSALPRPPRGFRWLLFVWAMIAGGTLAVMIYPFEFVGGGDDAWLSLTDVPPLIVLGNVLLFVPYGIAEGCLSTVLFRLRNVAVLLVLIDAAILSLIGESLQIWLPTRDSAIIDLVANTLGGTVGGLVGHHLARAIWFRSPSP